MNKYQNPNGTYDGIAVLADLSGLSRKSALQIMEEVKANHALLNACPYHDFVPLGPLRPVNQRYHCTKCGGEVDFHARFWHEKGRRQP